MMKRINMSTLGKACIVCLLACSLYANGESSIAMDKAEALVKEGTAQLITKKELNEIKKNNIGVEIQDLKSKNKEIIKSKSKEINFIEKNRLKELSRINEKYDEKRLVVENKRNQEIADIKKMILVKNKEIEMIDKIAKITLKAKEKEKELQKIIVINDIRGLREHIKEYKHINNVMMKLTLVDSLKMYLHAKVNNYTYSVLKRIKDYILKTAYDDKSIDYNAFESVINEGSNYDLENIIKIFEKERG